MQAGAHWSTFSTNLIDAEHTRLLHFPSVCVGGWVGVCVGLAPINPINAEQAVAAALLLLLLLLACCSTATAAGTLSPLSSLALLFASLIPVMCD